MVFPGDAAPAAESSRTKFSWQTKKASANFSGAKRRGAHFPAGGILFPVWPASGPEPNVSRPPAHSFSAPAGQNLPFTFSSRSGQPVNRQMLFAASVFQTRKHEVYIFSASKTIASGLTGQYLPLPILFPYQPYNLNKTAHFIPAPAGRLPPVLLLYRAQRFQTASTFPSGASRPTSPAAILFIPAPTILN